MSDSAFQSARILNLRLRNLNNLVLNLFDKPVVVLGYHRVTALPSDPNSLAVAPDNFRVHMEYLKQNFQIVRFDEDWSRVRKPAVVVTFDDGYADNMFEALPILEDIGVPATFFISTDNLETGSGFWWDELERMVLGGASYPALFELEDVRHGKIWPTATIEERKALLRDLIQIAMKINEEQRAGWIEQIREWGGGGGPAGAANRPLTPGELINFAKSKWVTVGAHTVTHSSLSVLSEEEQKHEIISSRQQLERILGKEINVFSYPFGKRSDYDTTTIRICREAGFLKAATAFPGHFYRWSDPYQIPRHFIHNWDLDSFKVRVKSFWI
jgi:peptidoglycan/xylan/chitin deacetylase (PgdA/CDA1 family)